jgi:hypothetical protein
MGNPANRAVFDHIESIPLLDWPKIVTWWGDLVETLASGETGEMRCGAIG